MKTYTKLKNENLKKIEKVNEYQMAHTQNLQFQSNEVEHSIIFFRTSELFRKSSDTFGRLQKISDMFVSSSEILVLSS